MATNLSTFWIKNPEIAKQITDLWDSGMSATQIVIELKLTGLISRSAVLGRMHRQGKLLTRENKTGQGYPKPDRVQLPRAKPIDRPRTLDANVSRIHAYRERIMEAPDESIHKVHLLDVRYNQCRWVLGAPVDGWFCGAPIDRDARMRFCPYHHQRALRISTPPNRGRFYSYAR